MGRTARKSYNHPCLIAQTLDILGDRWTLLVLRDLMSGLHRYSEILDSCSGMSPNVLSDRLKLLQAEGLVTRTYQKGLPPKVEYTLTDTGWSVRPILGAMLAWGRNNLLEIPDESVGDTVPTDFLVRVVSTFAFEPAMATNVEAVIVIEIDDCDDCNCSAWTLRIDEGRLLPSRHSIDNPDVRLNTDTEGFSQFIRGQASPELCGTLSGDLDKARSIQSCFVSS
jgi:DNA-binding HxlR family transcriptional regulator